MATSEAIDVGPMTTTQESLVPSAIDTSLTLGQPFCGSTVVERPTKIGAGTRLDNTPEGQEVGDKLLSNLTAKILPFPPPTF
jgi:hypothetical protein